MRWPGRPAAGERRRGRHRRGQQPRAPGGAFLLGLLSGSTRRLLPPSLPALPPCLRPCHPSAGAGAGGDVKVRHRRQLDALGARGGGRRGREQRPRCAARRRRRLPSRGQHGAGGHGQLSLPGAQSVGCESMERGRALHVSPLPRAAARRRSLAIPRLALYPSVNAGAAGPAGQARVPRLCSLDCTLCLQLAKPLNIFEWGWKKKDVWL